LTKVNGSKPQKNKEVMTLRCVTYLKTYVARQWMAIVDVKTKQVDVTRPSYWGMCVLADHAVHKSMQSA